MFRRKTPPTGIRWALIVLVSVVAVLALIWWLWLQAQDIQIGDRIATVATAVGAVVGFATALASWAAAEAAMRAARQSDETARHATEALGLAMEPRVRASHPEAYDESGKVQEIWVWNPTRWAAIDVEIIDKPAYGPEVHYDLKRLEPSVEVRWRPLNPVKIPALRPPEPQQLADPKWKGKLEWRDLLIVRYSDERGLLRWEATFGARYEVDWTDDFSRGMTTATIAETPRRIG